MKRDHFTPPLAFPCELIIEKLAGGGPSEGLAIAVNHDPEALARHALNHEPVSQSADLFSLTPTQIDPVFAKSTLMFESPPCVSHSKSHAPEGVK